MKKLKSNNRGSSSVEFMMAFMFTFVALLIAIEFAFLAIGKELTSYSAYIASRSVKVNDYAGVNRVIQKITPWVPAATISKGLKNSSVWVGINSHTAPILGKKAEFSLLKDLRLNIHSSMIIDRPDRKECEDNPLWYVKGEAECK